MYCLSLTSVGIGVDSTFLQCCRDLAGLKTDFNSHADRADVFPRLCFVCCRRSDITQPSSSQTAPGFVLLLCSIAQWAFSAVTNAHAESWDWPRCTVYRSAWLPFSASRAPYQSVWRKLRCQQRCEGRSGLTRSMQGAEVALLGACKRHEWGASNHSDPGLNH